jgi:preprotein translocase subunit SecG
MGALQIVFGIILIVAAVALIAVVLLQSGKDKTLSSAIAGGGKTDSFYSKNKTKAADKILEKVTAAVAILFSVIVLVSFIAQKDSDLEAIKDASTAEVTQSVVDTSADTEGSPAETSAHGSADTAASTDGAE